jgi:hypothetical protein
MEHRDAQSLLELAAVEPDGFARLAAGDTAEAAALAGHLAGCPECTVEFEHLGRLAGPLRASVRSLPSPDLRERTLALVAATGRARSAEPGTVAPGDATGAASSAATDEAPSARARSARPASRPWALATAAALFVAVAGVGGWWSARSDLEQEHVAAAQLAEVTEAAVRVGSQPDARTVELVAAPAGSEPVNGEVVLSMAGNELVVLGEGLPEPEPGKEYRCWVEIDGVRQPIGKLSLYAGLATWVGWSAALEGFRPGARIGVSLADIDGDVTGEPLLTGEL